MSSFANIRAILFFNEERITLGIVEWNIYSSSFNAITEYRLALKKKKLTTPWTKLYKKFFCKSVTWQDIPHNFTVKSLWEYIYGVDITFF